MRIRLACALIHVLLASVATTTQAEIHLWSQRYGDSVDQWADDVATDPSGNVIVTGRFNGIINFGGGSLVGAFAPYIFLAKLDTNGNHLWSKSFGTQDPQALVSQAAWGVDTDASGNTVLAGEFSGTLDLGGGQLTTAGRADIFLAKFDSNGNHLWSVGLGDDRPQRATAVSIDGFGNVFVTGQMQGTVDFGGGPLNAGLGQGDIFLAKLDADGNHLWSKRFGDNLQQEPNGLATDALGSVIVTGRLYGAADFGGGLLTSAGCGDVFVAKLDAQGSHVWSKRFGGLHCDDGRSVAVDGFGNIVVTGAFEASVDFGGGPLIDDGFGSDMFVAAFDHGGTHLFSFDPEGDLHVRRIVSDGQSNTVVTGTSSGTVDFGGGNVIGTDNDIFVASYDADGNHNWSARYGDGDIQNAFGLAVNGSNDVIVCGGFRGLVDFGGGVLTSVGQQDVFIAKLAQDVALPVAVQSFEILSINERVELTWSLSSQARSRLTGIHVERADDHAATFRRRSLAALVPESSVFVDAQVGAGLAYWYRLRLLGKDGTETTGPTRSIRVGALLAMEVSSRAGSGAPVEIEYSLSSPGRVSIVVYSVAGRAVRSIDDGHREPGSHSVAWDAVGNSGRMIGQGVYLVRLVAGSQQAVGKLTFLR